MISDAFLDLTDNLAVLFASSTDLHNILDELTKTEEYQFVVVWARR